MLRLIKGGAGQSLPIVYEIADSEHAVEAPRCRRAIPQKGFPRRLAAFRLGTTQHSSVGIDHPDPKDTVSAVAIDPVEPLTVAECRNVTSDLNHICPAALGELLR